MLKIKNEFGNIPRKISKEIKNQYNKEERKKSI